MDWAEAIERNAAALVRILAGLLASAGYADGTVAARLDGPIYRTVLRALRPLESAVRRLIVIAARGIKVDLPHPRPKLQPKPQAHVPAEKPARKSGGRAPSFKLFDTRKRFDLKPRRKRSSAKGAGPRAWFVDTAPPPNPVYLQTGEGWGPVPFPLWQPVQPPKPEPVPVQVPDGTVSALRLGRRLAAVKIALEDIPRQALRMARSIARRERTKLARPTTITSPLRIGRPPGLRKNPKDEVELLLKECHWLAQDALSPDTS